MDDKRFRLYGSIIVALLLIAIIRVATQSNPLYSAIEPVVVWIDERATNVLPIQAEEASLSQTTQAENEQLRAENQTLREQRGLAEDDRGISAEITRRDLLGFRKFVTINVGREDGIVLNQTVVTEGNLFGVVEEVYANTSMVRTVLDPEFRATVEAKQERGVLKVQHGSLVVDLVPSKDLNGTPVQTDGLDAQIVANVPVGILDQQVASEASIFGTYNVALPYNPFDVRFVEVLPRGGGGQ